MESLIVNGLIFLFVTLYYFTGTGIRIRHGCETGDDRPSVQQARWVHILLCYYTGIQSTHSSRNFGERVKRMHLDSAGYLLDINCKLCINGRVSG